MTYLFKNATQARMTSA
ncbi:hypothetical protein GQ600_5576 [Phytophthora cactorum]|nr:hypothetical protein GQ600_5576 [Phytophthora cactorum]